jgi:hypothetical protein
MTDVDWSLLNSEPAPESILQDMDPTVDGSLDDGDGPRIDRSMLKQPRRKAHAREYEDKLRGLFLVGTQIGLQSPNTVADAVTIIVHGPKVAQTMGDLAAENEMVANAIDFITKPSDSASTAAILAAFPMVLQLVRNHEPVAETSGRIIRIPYTKREIKLRFNIKLGRLRNMTQDPDELTDHVLAIPDISAAIEKWGIKVARGAKGRRANS